MGRLEGTIYMIMIRLQSAFSFLSARGGVLTSCLLKATGGRSGYGCMVLWCRGRCRRDVTGGSFSQCTTQLNSFAS